MLTVLMTTGLLVFGAGTGPVPLQVPRATDSAQDALAIRALAEGIIAADNVRDLSRVLDCYSANAMLLPPNDEPVVGRGKIRPRYERLFADYDPAIEGTIEEIGVGPRWGFVRGRNRGTLHSRTGGPARVLNDLYIMVVEREPDGRWRISRLIWHAGSATP